MTLSEKLKMEHEEGQVDELVGLVQDGLRPPDVAADRAKTKYGVEHENFLSKVSAKGKRACSGPASAIHEKT